MTQTYSDGTISVTAASTTVTGSGTAWQTALITGGVIFAGDGFGIIDTVDSNTQITLKRPWPGSTLAGSVYDIVPQSEPTADLTKANRTLAEIAARLNADGGVLWNFDTGTADADPGAGRLRADNASLTAATVLYISKTNSGGTDVAAFLAALDDSTAAIKGALVLTDPSTRQQALFDVTGITDATGYVKVAVSNASGVTAFDSDAPVGVIFARSGDDGADGADPGILLNFDAGTADSDPGAGNIRADNADLSAATQLFISKTGRGGNAITAFLLALDDSTSANKGQIVVTDPVSEAQAAYQVTGVTDATGYVKVAVSGHSGATAFADTLPVSFQFSRTGDEGAAIYDPSPITGFRNKIINGNFDIWQRGTSQTTADYGSVDRWRTLFSGGSVTLSQQAFTLGQSDVPGNPVSFARTVVTHAASASNFHLLAQRVEGVRTLAGKEVTVTFYAKADAAKNIAVELFQNFGTGGSPSASVTAHVETVALTTGWVRHSFTVNIPSISGKTLGTNGDDFLQLAFWLEAGSTFDSRTNSLGQQSGTFDIAHVSLVEGDATTEADPFSARSITEEENLCYRYYLKYNNPTYSYDFIAVGLCRSTFDARFILYTPVTLRADPSVSFSGDFRVFSGGAATVGPTISITSFTPPNALYINVVSSGLTSGEAAFLTASADLTAYVEIDAEL